MHTILPEHHLALYQKAIKGDIRLIGWGIRNGFHLNRWQELFSLESFVDSNIKYWDQEINGCLVSNPYILRNHSPESSAIIDYYMAGIVADYAKRTSGIECLPPMNVQHVLREAALWHKNGSRHKSEPMSQHMLDNLLKALAPITAKYSGKPHDIQKLSSLLSGYNWTDCVAAALRTIPQQPLESHSVLLVTNSLYPGGAERQMINCATGFSQKGWHAHFCSIMSDYVTPHYLHTLQQNDIPYHFPPADLTATNNGEMLNEVLAGLSPEARLALWHLPHEFILPTTALIRHIQKTKPRLIIAYLDWANVIAAFAGALCGVPDIIISGRNYPPDHFPHFFERVTPLFYNAYQVLANQPSVHFTNNAPDAGVAYAKWLDIPKEKITFVPNCLTASFMKRPPKAKIDAIKRQYGIKPKDKIVLGVFRLAPEKRPNKFVEVLAKLVKWDKNIKGIICGIGPLEPDLHKLAKKLGISDRLVFAGLTDSVTEFMNAADILLHTSAFEGMPNVMLEAQSQALPVVCTKSGGVINCLAVELQPYALDKNDWKGVVAAAQKLLNQPKLRKEIGEAARQYVRKEHSIPKLVARNLALTKVKTKTTKQRI